MTPHSFQIWALGIGPIGRLSISGVISGMVAFVIFLLTEMFRRDGVTTGTILALTVVILIMISYFVVQYALIKNLFKNPWEDFGLAVSGSVGIIVTQIYFYPVVVTIGLCLLYTFEQYRLSKAGDGQRTKGSPNAN